MPLLLFFTLGHLLTHSADIPPNTTELSDCFNSACSLRSSCTMCLNSRSCLWCPSLSRCLPAAASGYPTTFSFGQCLGWVSLVQNPNFCAMDECQEQLTCSSCQTLPHCGWCNDATNTGLGKCTSGGFLGPRRNDSSCMIEGGISEGDQEGDWQFDTCSRELRLLF